MHFGIPWAPEEFIVQAKAVRHPFGEPTSVSDRHRYAIFMHLTQGVEAIRWLRATALEYWKKRASELQDEEVALFRRASPLVQPCWGDVPTWKRP